MQIVSWDSHNINEGVNYTATLIGGRQRLPKSTVNRVDRIGEQPLVAGVEQEGERLSLLIGVLGSGIETLLDNLCAWFDPRDQAAKTLVVEDDDGGNDRYVYAVCESLLPYQAKRHLQVATMVVHGDIRFREVTPSTDSWSVTASGQTKVVANGGTDLAFPIFTIEPTGGKAGDQYVYWRHVFVRWPNSVAVATHPVDVGDDAFDTQTIIGAGKMQADGDDLRVEVDGIEVDRWLDGIDTATTKVWINLDFQAKWEGTITADIGAGDSVTAIDVNEDANRTPARGILMVNDEAYIYTDRAKLNDDSWRFTIGSRAAKNTSAGAHTAGDAIWWCQHEIVVRYGNGAATAPSVDGDYEPAFELDHSTNGSWVYEEFGEDDGLRPGAWQRMTRWGEPAWYGGDQGAAGDPWAEAGIEFDEAKGKADYRLYHPGMISNVDITNGEKYASTVANFVAAVMSGNDGCCWATEYTIPVPGVASTWEAWSRDEAISNKKFVCVMLRNQYKSNVHRVEMADCTVTIATTPTISMGSEQSVYVLDCEIENTTTGDVIELRLAMDLNEELEVNTDAKTVTYVADGSSQFQALTLQGGNRQDWLPLATGNNTLKFTDVNTQGVTIGLEWEERFY